MALAALVVASPPIALGEAAPSLTSVAPSSLTLTGSPTPAPSSPPSAAATDPPAATTSYAAGTAVTIRNGSGRPVRLSFRIVVDPEGSAEATAGVPAPTVRLVDPANDTLAGLGVDQFRLAFTGGDKFSGTLVVEASATGGTPEAPELVGPATIPLSFTPAREGLLRIPSWAGELSGKLLAACLGLGFALTFGRYLASRRVLPWLRRPALEQAREGLNKGLKLVEGSTEPGAEQTRRELSPQLDEVQRRLDAPLHWRLGNPMGGVEWDLQKSYGSELGLVAAVLAAVTGAGFFPAEIFTDKGQYFGLVLTFAVLTLVAPMFYAVCQRKLQPEPADPSKPQWMPIATTVNLRCSGTPLIGTLTSTRADPPAEEEVLGSVWAFLVTSAITIGAVAGQVWTVFLLLDELLKASAVTDAAIYALDVATGATFVLLIVYFVRTTGWIIEKQAREEATRPRWSPL